MSKASSAQLKAHYASGSTTISRQWRLERPDGLVKTLTNCSRDLLIGGEVYRSREGLTPTAIEQQADGAVANGEVMGVLSEDFATEAEIAAGVWDNTQVTMFEVNYRDLTMGQMIIGVGTIGNLEAGRLVFKGEYRGLLQALQQTTGRVFTPGCQAQLGDAECKVNVEAMRYFGTLTSVASRRSMTDSANPGASDLYGAGVLRLEGGPMSGAEMEVYAFATGAFTLVLPFPQNIDVGTPYSVIPGCRKRHERGARNVAGVSDCKDKFNNVVNFRGFSPSQFPGNNRILGLGSNSSTSYNP